MIFTFFLAAQRDPGDKTSFQPPKKNRCMAAFLTKDSWDSKILTSYRCIKTRGHLTPHVFEVKK